MLILQLELFYPKSPSTLCIGRCQFSYKAHDTWHLIQYNKKNQWVRVWNLKFSCANQLIWSQNWKVKSIPILMKFQYVVLDEESFVLTGVGAWSSSPFAQMLRPTWWGLFSLLNILFILNYCVLLVYLEPIEFAQREKRKIFHCVLLLLFG